MPKNNDIKCVLVIGSGPVVIGQAAEFDYAGSQACLSLKEEGIKVVLLNSNPATIQTDNSIADRIYIEPIESETVSSIIKTEHVDSLLVSMGGQTALNIALDLQKSDILGKLKILGTSISTITIAEDRKKFHRLMRKISEPIPDSKVFNVNNFRNVINTLKYYPVIARTSFSLGGSSGAILKTKQDLEDFAKSYFAFNKSETIEIEQSLEGLKEIEYEVIRDNAGNSIIICNMENLDIMGVHTGESIVVTPSQTLSDQEYHMLRDAAIKIISALNIHGACNIQFALDQRTSKYYVIEVNPRTSRSSALASKATGYPIARIATKIAIGYNLTEIKNPITKNTYAAYEPSLDYITVKIPRWPFDKFVVDRTTGIEMKSIGEVMGIGRTFEEALMKSISSLETDNAQKLRLSIDDNKLIELLYKNSDLKIFAIFEALFRNYTVLDIARISGYNPYFVYKINTIVSALRSIKPNKIFEHISELKKLGIADTQISHFTKLSEDTIIKERIEKGILPSYKAIDTCSAEFDTVTPYLYSTYESESEFENIKTTKKKIIVIGSGPNRISQGLEFDYGAVKAIMTLKKEGYWTIMINNNPETVSTDFDISDTLYFEPLTLEHISNIIIREKPEGIILQFSGQTGQNIASMLEKLFSDKIILGTKPFQITSIENRTIFAEKLKLLNIQQPEFTIIKKASILKQKHSSLIYPVIVRSSFIIGGRAMDIVYNYRELQTRVKGLFKLKPDYPVLISKYIEKAVEIDIDFVADGDHSTICGILTHIEEAGTHSGDAIMVFGPNTTQQKLEYRIFDIVKLLVKTFDLVGLSNLQIAVKGEAIYIIELNARSSRSVPFVSKATGVNCVELAIKAMLGHKFNKDTIIKPKNSYFVKVPVFPFSKIKDLDIILGPEMKSTGEGLGAGKTLEEAMIKALKIYKSNFHINNYVLTSVDDDNQPLIVPLVKLLTSKNIKILATPGTGRELKANNINFKVIYKIEDSRLPKITDIILDKNISMIINTPTLHTGPIRDGFTIRRLALKKDILVVTNINFAKAVIDAWVKNPVLQYRELRYYNDSVEKVIHCNTLPQ